MNIGKARALFEQVASGEYHGSTVGEYLEAIKIILDMETHNSISKKMIISVCKWLVEIAEKAVSPYRWIPVSERLPEKGGESFFDGMVLITLRDKETGDLYVLNDKYCGDGDWLMCVPDEPTEVLAWMPLPEAYKPNNK